MQDEELHLPSTSSTPSKRKRKAAAVDEEAEIAQEKKEVNSTGTWMRSVSTGTEGNLIGICEPGTQVCLEGCIFHEDPEGFLVVNVTWRGKSYVGTLVDSSRQEWGPPRPEESAGEVDRKGLLKGRNGKRNGRESIGGRAGGSRQGTPIPRNKSRSVMAGQISVDEDEDSILEPPRLNEPLSPVLTECPCAQCKKKFASPIALKYHQEAQHKVSLSENESLQMLFAPVQPTKTEKEEAHILKEELEERPSSRSPAYSDISDESAPTLSKEGGRKRSISGEAKRKSISVSPQKKPEPKALENPPSSSSQLDNTAAAHQPSIFYRPPMLPLNGSTFTSRVSLGLTGSPQPHPFPYAQFPQLGFDSHFRLGPLQPSSK